MNIVDVIKNETTGLEDQHVAVISSNCRLTYRDLFRRVDCLEALVKTEGIAPGDRVVLLFPDGIDYICLSLALLAAGAAVVPATVSTSPGALIDILEKTSARFMLSEENVLRESANRVSAQGMLVDVDKFFLTSYAPSEDLPDAYDDLEPAFIRFSSGTTGASKGVLISHQAVLARTDTADQALRICADDVILWVLPMAYHFVVSILLFLRRGATIRLCCEDFPFSLATSVSRGEGTFIYATPFHYRALRETSLLDGASLNGIRMAISTAMKLPLETALAFRTKFGFALTEAYGIIEVGLPFVNETATKPEGSVGRAVPGFEVMLKDAGDTGEGAVLLRGPGMYTAYLHPWRVRQSGEWFDTGDIGRIDKDGFLYLLGRTKHVINFAGMKVFPYEVEAVLEACLGVTGALVYGKVHPRYGETPCARVEVSDASVTPSVVRRFCYSRLVPYKVPKTIEIVARLERTGSGKVVRPPQRPISQNCLSEGCEKTKRANINSATCNSLII